ncbi:cytochrome P450 [Polychytrium aggregatum]|uniref:cytochrome P450 n=1 Tax=Polychytrium aggregatum TaxID=110093 RepID=UPI0022FE9F82|nr:cytochrome P450 [Polychytrium aggregatum]KAI9203389.1 cytochrome P450 [Polychytrium aggregatum]
MLDYIGVKPVVEGSAAFVRQHSAQLLAATIVAAGVCIATASFNDRKRIPGPKSWPLIGEFLALSKHIARRDVHLYFHGIQRKYGPISQVQILNHIDVLLSDADEVKRVLKGDDNSDFARSNDFQNCSKGIAYYALFTLPSGDIWKRHRKFLQPSFGPVQLRAAADATNQYVELMIAKLGARAKVNAHLVTNAVVLDVIGGIAFSKDLGMTARLDHPSELEEAFLPYKHLTQVISDRFDVAEWLWDIIGAGLQAGIKDSQPVKDFTRQALEERRSSPTPRMHEDLMDRLLFVDTSGEAKFTEEEIMDEIVGFFLAGHDTTANLITFVLIELLKHPHVCQKARQEVDDLLGHDGVPTHDQLSQFKYIDMVVKETLRMYPPAPLMSRRAIRDTQILGYPVKRGTDVDLVISHLHRNPKYWTDPEEYIPERWLSPPYPGSFIPFGDGPMNCIGQKMANIETKIFVIRILQRYTFKILDPSQLRVVFSITQGYKDGVDVLFEERK